MSTLKTCVVTGAGSGVGQALALKLVQQGWRVALVGRRAEALNETIQQAQARGDHCLACPCDVGDANAVSRMAQRVLTDFGGIEVLVNAAGTNAPRRALEVLALDDYHAMMNTNLHGAFYCVQALLPQMRARRSGTIVNIVSDAGKLANPKAGPAYAMSKFGLAGLTQSINAEERGRGVRACAIFPGDIDTPLLLKRPQPPEAQARSRMMQAEDIAECALLCINLPPRAIVEEILVRPR
jgi:NAD(P)-dependent dehydrogenase (short-subunit alcohol dehydrogenase family)